MRYLLYFVVVFSTLSCSDLKPREVSLYFSLDSLINEQSNLLKESKAELYKYGIVNGDSISANQKPDSIQWADEFKLFVDSDINKPALRGNYKVSINQDHHSNLEIKQYDALSESCEVKSLKLYFLDDLQNLKKIEISSAENNSIFKASKKLKLTFDNVKSRIRLTSYEAEGYQKMVLQDTVNYSIRGEIKY